MTTVSILSLVTTDISSTENCGNLPVEGEAASEISKLASVPPEPTASNSDEPSSDELRALAQEELVRLGMVGALTVEDVLGDEGSMKEIRQTWQDRRQAKLAKEAVERKAAQEQADREARAAQARADRERQDKLTAFRQAVAASRPVTADDLKEWIDSRIGGQDHALVQPEPTKKDKPVKTKVTVATAPTSKPAQKPALPAIPEAVVVLEKQIGEKLPILVFRRVGYALALRGLLISWIKWVQGEMRRNESDGLREYGVALQHHIELVNQLIKAWGKQISDRSTPAEFDDLKTEMRKLPTKHNMVLLSSSQTWIAAVAKAKAKAAQEVCDHQVQSEQVEAEARSANLQQMVDLLTKSNPDLGKAAAQKLAATVLKKHGGKFRLAAAHKTELARNEEDLQIALWYSNAADLQESQK